MPETLVDVPMFHFKLAGDHVVIAGVILNLLQFADTLSLIHSALFGDPLVITAGKDSIHSAGSLHYQGQAIDVRTHDLDASQQVLFAAVMAYLETRYRVTVFDENNLPGEAHYHIEWHGAA